MGAKIQASGRGAPRKRRLRRALLVVLVGGPALLIGLFVAANRIPWVGPLLADTARALVGAGAVAKLEDASYAAQDRWNRFWRKDEQPRAHWSVPEPAPSASAAEPATAEAAAPALPPFRPRDVGPALKSWSAPGDGLWVPLADARHPEESPRLYKTLLHPDRNRSWAEVFVVAVDLRQTDLEMVPGTREPKAETPESAKLERPGRIPASAEPRLLAAFNGGWKTEHGHYGMGVGGLTLIPPRKTSCTVARTRDGRVRIASWDALADSKDDLAWWRQTPRCMYENGTMHALLNQQETAAWGATVDGDTIIRRSAIGIDAAGETLFVSITNHTTARALADAMHFAGASTVAQLDVNWSFPKFVVYEPNAEGVLEATPLAEGFEFDKGEYLRRASLRDFFFITRKADGEAAKPTQRSPEAVGSAGAPAHEPSPSSG